ncbi:MAG: hypothetical protein CBC25_04360 [Pelagibacteraceae bacterium TMED65]|nr:MAG: hypothetical protein CBC25_04360 [Pelagibacteraceae bacterium TMED65]|tara:strand:- start:410 stop:1708 length:1299 start_codon:yes stop_codon:yes gene_type:complete
MILEDGSKLDVEQIELLNANGPYTMAVWKSGEVSIGNEEGLAGRSEYFLKKIRETILENYNLDELRKMSVLDIGCNDGWILHNLSDLPFKKMVGIEPREKNIEKGKLVRKILKLKNRVDYRVGDIESLKGEIYDIVLCCGVLYHVESIPTALRNIRQSCSKLIFIESRCLSSEHISESIKSEIEMRDLVYQFKDKICGLTAQKFESSYHDGSASKTTIVNVPSTETLIMNLELLGFDNIEVVADPETYRRDVWQDKRPLGGVCISAKISNTVKPIDESEVDWIINYEKQLEKQILPKDFIKPLFEYFSLKKETILSDELKAVKAQILDGSSIDLSFLPEVYQNKITYELINNFKYRPAQKIALEYGKLCHSQGNNSEALDVLKRITTELNADWRAAYRSNHILSKIYKDIGENELADKHKRLCLQANPKYPV